MVKRIFVLLLFSSLTSFVQSQTIPDYSVKREKLYTYFLCFKGIVNKLDVVNIEQIIRKNKEVSYFLGERFPVRYFTLKSISPINKQQLISWIKATPYTLLYFGIGEESLEEAIMVGKKNY